MNKDLLISGFSDEISSNFNTQLRVVSELGMKYVCLRGIDGKNIGDFTVEEAKENILPRLLKAGIGVSSIGSPLGKIFINDEASFENQKGMLDRLCKIAELLNCKYIRIFSFFIPKGENSDNYRNEVISKLIAFAEIAKNYNIILLHENEKDIYGDIGRRCKEILKEVGSAHFKGIFDFANFVQCGEDPQECYDLLKDEIEYIHIKDAVLSYGQNVPCGTGDGKIREILSQAIHNGFKGFLTLEPHLVRFESLKDLEVEGAEQFVKASKSLDGASAYKHQYDSLLNILGKIQSRENRMAEVRLGIIGIGAQGGTYARFITEGKVKNMVLGAICDIDPSKKEMVEEKYPDVPFYDNYIEMIESDNVDAIVTCVPHYLHPEMAINALKRNIHTLGEKPAGVYTKQVRELNEFAATKPELTFGIMFNQRTNPLYQKVKEVIDNGEIGKIRRTNWIITTWWRPQGYYDQGAWRATWSGEGGGVLVNQAPHQIDLLQWICGMPKKVYSNLKYGYQRNITVEDEVTALLDYGNGATGVFITCTHDVLGTDRFEILGDKGKIIVDDSRKVTIKRLVRPESEMSDTVSWAEAQNLFSGPNHDDVYSEEVVEFESVWGAQHIAVLENFAANIVDGTPLLAPGSDGINGVTLANAMHLSSWLGREIEIPFDEELYVAELNKKIEEEKKIPVTK
ncbi:Gfo/Idh/MocA family protein [Metabacillus sp. RGM 3146]|uniref:Gfo/Idh/MocA family protein n=1 Tax=Metabacillus sp. RGM 3146 TaxID=3401092 RepID=UPI003B9A5709